jgi:RND family efflux transporter MFP subunit
MPNRQRRLWIIVTLVGVAMLIAIIAWVQRTPKTPPVPTPVTEPQAAALTVTLTQPEMRLWPRQLTATGNVNAWQEAIIGSEISGYRLTQVNANVGDRVHQGQVLAEINRDALEADALEARAAVAEAEAVLADATADANRSRALKDSGALSDQEIAKSVTSQQTAKARLDAARARVQAQQVRQTQSHIIAPDDGIISARSATVGSLTQSGQELFRMIRGGRLEWRAEVTADDLNRIQTGMTAHIVTSNPTAAAIVGTVRTIAPVIDDKTRNVLVYVDVPANSGLRAGMFVRGQFDLGNQPALTLPQSAVLLRDGFAYVFVLGDKQRVSERKVTLGSRMGDRVEVQGLAQTAQIVATGAAFLGDGDRVKVAQAMPVAVQQGQTP